MKACFNCRYCCMNSSHLLQTHSDIYGEIQQTGLRFTIRDLIRFIKLMNRHLCTKYGFRMCNPENNVCDSWEDYGKAPESFRKIEEKEN